MSETFTVLDVHNVPVHFLASQQYKTNYITLYFRQPLSEEHHTLTALVPAVLKRGTVNYPSARKLRQAMDDLYQASIHTDVLKKGDEQITILRMEVVNEHFLRDKIALFEKSVALLNEVLYNPLLEVGAFHSDFVQIEKKLLATKLARLEEDKIRYANKRMIEEMFQHEPYRLHAGGSAEQLEQITAQQLFSQYEQMITQQPLSCYVIGDLSTEKVEQVLAEHFTFRQGTEQLHIAETKVHEPVQQIKRVTEKTKISQGKLHIGCRTQTAYQDDDLITLLVFNGVFGGFPHSKLFRNVREKESLAYYCSSALEMHKGFMMIYAGIEYAHQEKTEQIILEQLRSIQQGEISEQELNDTKALLINQVKQAKDQPFQLIDRHFNGVLGGKVRTGEEMIQEIKQVTANDVQQVAQKIEVDTIYFLTTDEEGGASS